MAHADPLDAAAAHRVGERIEGVADQGEDLLHADLLERADKHVRDGLRHSRLLRR